MCVHELISTQENPPTASDDEDLLFSGLLAQVEVGIASVARPG